MVCAGLMPAGGFRAPEPFESLSRLALAMSSQSVSVSASGCRRPPRGCTGSDCAQVTTAMSGRRDGATEPCRVGADVHRSRSPVTTRCVPGMARPAAERECLRGHARCRPFAHKAMQALPSSLVENILFRLTNSRSEPPPRICMSW